MELKFLLKELLQLKQRHKHGPIINTNTWKALFGISLKGIVTFVLPLWTSRVSEKKLAKCSGLLGKLEPLGDDVIAGRGLTLQILRLLESLLIFQLTHFSPMSHFYTP